MMISWVTMKWLWLLKDKTTVIILEKILKAENGAGGERNSYTYKTITSKIIMKK